MADVAPAPEPPPEPQENARTRRWVIASFWAVVLLLSLPLWWATTTVYRANLPLEQMKHWADGEVCAPIYPLRIALDTPSLPQTDAQHLLRSAQHALDDLNDFPAHHLRLSLPRDDAEPSGHDAGQSRSQAADGGLGVIQDIETALAIKLVQRKDATSPTANLVPHSRQLVIEYASSMLPSSGSSPSVLGSFIATTLRDVFEEEQAMLAALRHDDTAAQKPVSPELATILAERSTRSVKYAPTYHLTFSLLSAAAFPSDWAIEEALRQSFVPLLHALAPISNFTIDTQVQPYSTLPRPIQLKNDEANKQWLLEEKDLGGFINAAEWPLSPSIGAGPTINFVLYVPSDAVTPLHIEGATDDSWLVPQWGGVALLNAHKDGQATALLAKDLMPAMVTFSHELMLLLGLPDTPVQSLPMRLSTLTRVRAASLFYSASSTLGSLARLVLTLPSISIPDSVAHHVAQTINHLEASCADFRAGNFKATLDHGKLAEQHAERAFFEKSMVGQVYFPDEHKVAVYLPLLGPVTVPLLIALIRELRLVLKQRRARKAKAE